MICMKFDDDMSPSRIFHKIANDPLGESKNWTYIILGNAPRTGKTWLCNALREKGFNAFEISEEIAGLVMYQDNQNHVETDSQHNKVVIILNHPLWKYAEPLE